MNELITQQQTAHIPVLLQEVIDVLAPKPGDRVVDGTLGGGGHAEALLDRIGTRGVYLGIDEDAYALERVRARLGKDKRLHTVQGNFRDMVALAEAAGISGINKILLDLGLSSDQLESTGEEAGRGFTFLQDEPLAMTFSVDPAERIITAHDIVNEWEEVSLADVIYGFGEERKARHIARAIVTARMVQPIETSLQLAEIIATAVGTHGKTHPATRTFQALRIVVNDELGALTTGLAAAQSLVVAGGRIAVISFHSLEDRVVKRTFAGWEQEGFGCRVTKRPIVPSREECAQNRRARSAKLRCFEVA